ncbi:hypothetical protein AAHH79_38145, partial [Burkholderia pseudomallei]
MTDFDQPDRNVHYHDQAIISNPAAHFAFKHNYSTNKINSINQQISEDSHETFCCFVKRPCRENE